MEVAALIIAVYLVLVAALTVKCMMKAQQLPDDFDNFDNNE